MKWLLTAIAVAFLGVGLWVLTWESDTPPVSYRVLSTDLSDPSRAVVTFEVDKDPAATAECLVTATGEKRDIVNRLSGIRIPPADTRRTVHKVTVPTDQPPTSAAVATCVVTGRP